MKTSRDLQHRLHVSDLGKNRAQNMTYIFLTKRYRKSLTANADFEKRNKKDAKNDSTHPCDPLGYF